MAAAGVHERTRNRRLLLLTDFDGTLAELVSTPGAARISTAVSAEIERFADLPNATLGVVSGRRAADVRARVGPAVTFVAGLHGLEVEGPAAAFRHEVLRVVEPIVAGIVRTARRDLAWCRGAYLEDKTYSVTCHVRGVPAHAAGRALDEFEAIARPHVTAGVLRLLSASEALEVLPATDWHKGRAVDWIRAHETARTSEPMSVVYLGDDRTDEDAFAALGPDDAAIGVGRRPAESLIDWRLAGPELVGRFLSHLGRRRRQSAGPSS